MKDCFIRAYDDSIVIRATGENNTDIHIDRCVLWNDWGASIGISARGKVELIEDITFKNIDVIRASSRVLEIGNHAKTVIRNIQHENINVEFDDWMPTPKLQEEKGEVYVPDLEKTYLPRLLHVYMDGEGGSVSDVTYHNINIIGNTDPPSSFRGLDAEHAVRNISIKNFRFNGRAITDFKEAHITIGNFVNDVEIE
jgi:hypothetical protein